MKKKIQIVSSEHILEITTDEIYNALSKVKNNRPAGPDDIMSKMLKHGGQNLIEEFKEIFDIYLKIRQIRES